jgi:cystathionine beta-lyase
VTPRDHEAPFRAPSRIVNSDDLLLPVDPLERLRQRRSAKWQTYPRDVLPLTVAEMDFALAPAVSAALRDAVERSDAGYAMPVPGLGQAVAAFAARRWSWDIDPASIAARFPPDTRWRIGHLGVIATVAAYTEGEAWLDQLLRTLDHRRLVLGDLLAERLPAISWQAPEATFLAWLDCRGIGPDDEARELFLRNGKVALEPGLRFGAAGAGYARLNFATSVDILDQAAKRMARAIAG